MVKKTDTPVMFRLAWFILCLFIIMLKTAGCAKKIEKGDPGPVITLLKCMNANIPMPVNNEFSNPQKVTIYGYTGHAQDPFISRDGNYLFFNSLNDAIDTSLYYATNNGDGTFQFVGEIDGVNDDPSPLDAVSSMDKNNKFYFVTTRNYYNDHHTLFTGTFSAGKVSNIQIQTGDFYNLELGWIIMDAGVSPDGQDLYFVDAHFYSGLVPDICDIGVAHYDSLHDTFNIDPNSSTIMANINTSRYLEYGMCISENGLELFFTRANLCLGITEILVATRNSKSDPFGNPARIVAITGFAEAPSLAPDGKTLYYHMNDNGVYTIYKVSRP